MKIQDAKNSLILFWICNSKKNILKILYLPILPQNLSDLKKIIIIFATLLKNNL